MKAIFNDQIVPLQDPVISLDDRGFGYGDGLFETMFGFNGKIRFLDYHLERVSRGAGILNFDLPSAINNSNISHMVGELTKLNHINGRIRIKLMVWRTAGGTYQPETIGANFSLLVTEGILSQKARKKVVLAEEIHTQWSPFSQFKTLSSLPYTFAGIEMKKKAGDDIIITDQSGNISECLYSNIFWKKKTTFFTPSLKTGCIAGVMRRRVLELFKDHNIGCEEVAEKPQTLKGADEVFITNAGGIYPLLTFLDHQFAEPEFPIPLRPLLYGGEDHSFQG